MEENVQTHINIEDNQYYQNVDEMVEEIYHKKKKRNRLKDVELDTRSIRVLSFFIFAVFGLLLGTFVFSDYITITLIGITIGILVGQILSNKREQEIDEENENEDEEKDKGQEDNIEKNIL